MGVNFWFEHHIDAYLQACAEGRDWKEAVAEAERAIGDAPRRVLTRKALETTKGIDFSRQYLRQKVRDGDFPPPFQTPSTPKPKVKAETAAAAEVPTTS
jgi:hypothetical protein